jgi:hypothetical protein
MTISDEPTEDAANLDDDALFEAYLNTGPPSILADEYVPIPDWPPIRTQEVSLMIDAATLAWFKSSCADWRIEAGYVLRAWVAAQTDVSRDDADSDGPSERPVVF